MQTQRTEARILILKTGATFAATRRRFGDFDRWFLDSLRTVRARFDVWDVTRLPAPSLVGYDGVIVTGSPAAVYDDPAWLASLAKTLRGAVEDSTPLLGVCFGAQALAAAMGGRVVANPLGWEIGTISVRRTEAGVSDPLFGQAGETAAFLSTHQDVIEALPGEATVLAGNEMCPIQAFRIGPRAWGVQFHPEATPAILEDLIRARRAVLEAPPSRFGTLLDHLEQTPEGRRLLLRFVEGICAQQSPACQASADGA